MARALIVTDGKAGHENQSRAFARALGLEPDVFEVHFRTRFHKTLSYAFDWLGVGAGWLFDRLPPPGDHAVVIGTGSGTFYAAKTIARQRGIRCGVVLYPRGYRLSTFDCILAPAFDNPKPAENVIAIPANLVANDAEFYAKGVAAFRERCAGSGAKAVAVIVGGPNKCSTMDVAWMKDRLEEIFAANRGCDFWVTTSRRTPPDVERLVDEYPWNYRLLYSQDHFNPIPAFVQLASRLYVTAESTGMLSEACTFGTAEVLALDNLKPGPHKFRRFVEGLRKGGYVNGSRKVDLSGEFARARDLLKVGMARV